jgi:hypothetical protein
MSGCADLPSYPVKDPNDVLSYGMDFTAQMTADNDTVSSLQIISSSNFSAPTDASAITLTVATPAMIGNVASCVVSGGTACVTYRLVFRIQTIAGSVYERSGLLPVNFR